MAGSWARIDADATRVADPPRSPARRRRLRPLLRSGDAVRVVGTGPLGVPRDLVRRSSLVDRVAVPRSRARAGGGGSGGRRRARVLWLVLPLVFHVRTARGRAARGRPVPRVRASGLRRRELPPRRRPRSLAAPALLPGRLVTLLRDGARRAPQELRRDRRAGGGGGCGERRPARGVGAPAPEARPRDPLPLRCECDPDGPAPHPPSRWTAGPSTG